MNIVKTRIPAEVLPILAASTIAGNVLTLPAQLDRETYVRVDKALKAARGKWDRKAKGHVFPFDPRELMAEAVETGEVVNHKQSLGFFETPVALATRMAELADVRGNQIALEPSAGMGRIVRALMFRGAQVEAVEVDPTNCTALRAISEIRCVTQQDFLEYARIDASRFDAVVMNPPFANGQDMAHIRAAWGFVRPGGKLVAICSEGPFFRSDRASTEFCAWLEEIGADAEKLPADTFRESGTGVNARLILAAKPGQIEHQPEPELTETTVRHIPMAQIEPDPDQPRKTFEPGALSELAASIRADGLLQPITVREVEGPVPFRIVAGERRWRAHQVNGAATIQAIVRKAAPIPDVRVTQIIENDQRVDVTPLEQARSYQGLMDETGWTVEELGRRIGKAPHRILERTVLLGLQPEYQQLLASGNLKPSEATELARLTSPRAQTTLFNAIRTGGCRTYNDLRASANALVQAEQQFSLMPDAPPPPSDEDRRLANSFESSVDRLAVMLRSAIHDNQIVAVRKVNPDRASYLADLLAAMQKDMRRIEVALREAAVQASFLEGVA